MSWTINNSTPEELGLKVVGWTFRSGSASSVQLTAGMDFDAAETFAHGAAITIKNGTTKFFQGVVRAIPKSGSAGSESQEYIVEDAWADLERLTYQEPWYIRQADYTGSFYSPEVILGIDSGGSRLTVGDQISEVLAFASSMGVNIEAGAIPAGMELWPSKVNGMSCAQIIRDCLRYYPDWMAWINHTTLTPTFNVTALSSAGSINLAVTECSDLSVTKTQDSIPTGVRIVYLTANTVENGGETDIYRNVAIDQAPRPPGITDEAWTTIKLAPAPQGVIVTTVELAGIQMQIQKQQVKTRTLPTTNAQVAGYLKKKFPQLEDIDAAKLTVTGLQRILVTETEAESDPIDSKLIRHAATDLDKMPRELVKGSVPEYAQRFVGRMRLQFTLTAGGSATAEERAIIQKIPTNFVVVGTNATTKIYKGVASYSAGDTVPTGIAQAYYDTITDGCYFAGGVTLHDAEIDATVWMGSTLNLTGSDNTDWDTMAAPIHSVSCDVDSGETRVEFGPAPELSFGDFTEFLSLLSKRQHTNYTTDERTSDTLGDAAGTSANGESAGPYDVAETITLGGGGDPEILQFEISVGTSELIAAAGTLDGAAIGATIETAPADGTWYLEAKLTINASTSVTTARAVQWVTAQSPNTSTDFHAIIGSVDVVDGMPDAATISQATYGPLLTVKFGTPTDKWGVTIF